MKCGCGCGEDAGTYADTRCERGHKKGDPRRFIPNHRVRAKGAAAAAWKGGVSRWITSAGYIRCESDGVPYQEHRAIMAASIGRELLAEEVVHHINGNRRDNRRENLRLFASQSEHAKHHASIRTPEVTT